MPDLDNLPIPFPYSLMRDNPRRYVEWTRQVGTDEAERVQEEVARKFMRDHGNRAVLILGEIMGDTSAVLAEFSTVELT